MVVTSLFAVKQLVFTLVLPMAEQMFPIEQGENWVIELPVDGFIRNFWPASQTVELRGQHCWALTVTPSAHVAEVQSWTAPKVWPVSCAIICHSVRAVLTTTLAELTVSFTLTDAVFKQACPSQASPTAEPVGQVVRSVQYALVSFLVPRHPEKRLRRSWMEMLLLQAEFQGAEVGAVAGHAESLIVRFRRPRVMLKALSYWADARAIWEIICDRTAAVELKVPVYVQSVATPTKATLRVLKHPAVFPIVETRLTPPLFPDVVPSICLPNIDLAEPPPQKLVSSDLFIIE
jgi:hypothetical protein